MDEEKLVEAVQQAAELCASKGQRLTLLRREVYRALLLTGAPIKAYDLLESMREAGRKLTPASLYRVLDFLIGMGLVHRLNTLNAYVACQEQHSLGPTLLFVCANCRRTAEIHDPGLFSAMQGHLNALGMTFEHDCLEIHGRCRFCQEKSKPG